MMTNYHLYRKAWRFSGAPHEESKLSQADCKALLRQGGLLIRNTYNFDCQYETKFWYVIKDHLEGFEELSPRVRNKIRHAFNVFDYRLIDQTFLKENGYHIIAETFADYAVSDRTMNEKVFKNYLASQKFDCWGVFDKKNDTLIGFICVRQWKDSCEYDLSGMIPRYKRNGSYPYYGLYHTLNRYYLEEQGFRYVSDGSRSITEHSNIHDFLIQNFNFRKAYCHLQVQYNWWMKIAVKLLYPFRRIITNRRVKAILNMEGMTH